MSARCIKCVGLGEHGPCDEHSSFMPQISREDNTPEGQHQRASEEQFTTAIAAAKAEGAQEERAAIVAWLRNLEEGWASLAARSIAQWIEHGEHLKPGAVK